MKREKGLAGVDVSIAIVAVVIFTSIILSLMYNVRVENRKITMKTLATLYLVETLENVGIANYDDVTEANADKLLPSSMPEDYSGAVTVQEYSEEETEKDNLIKTVSVTISYKLGANTYEETIQRLKIKE